MAASLRLTWSTRPGGVSPPPVLWHGRIRLSTDPRRGRPPTVPHGSCSPRTLRRP